MNQSTIRAEILKCLETIAPEIKTQKLDDQTILRDQVDLDSLDYLNFLTKVCEHFKIQINEKDYPKIKSIEMMTKYINNKINEKELDA